MSGLHTLNSMCVLRVKCLSFMSTSCLASPLLFYLFIYLMSFVGLLPFSKSILNIELSMRVLDVVKRFEEFPKM